MIVAHAKNTMLDILTKLNHSKFTFHLTGSRYFGHALLDSDWDFFVEPSQDLRNYLRSLGFKEHPTSKYAGDPHVQTVFRHPVGTGIDIQLVPDPGLKSRIQEYIKTTPLWLMLLNKQPPRVIWTICYQLAKDFDAFRG